MFPQKWHTYGSYGIGKTLRDLDVGLSDKKDPSTFKMASSFFIPWHLALVVRVQNETEGFTFLFILLGTQYHVVFTC